MAKARDPTNKNYLEIMRNLNKSVALKEEANKLVKENKLDEAVAKFKECLEIDQNNISYNSIINMNMAITLSKQKKFEEALKAVNQCI